MTHPHLSHTHTACFRRRGRLRAGQATPTWRRWSRNPWTSPSPWTPARKPWPTSCCCPSCSRCGWRCRTRGNARVSIKTCSVFIILYFAGWWGGGGGEPAPWSLLARHLPGKDYLYPLFAHNHSAMVNPPRHAQRVRLAAGCVGALYRTQRHAGLHQPRYIVPLDCTNHAI